MSRLRRIACALFCGWACLAALAPAAGLAEDETARPGPPAETVIIGSGAVAGLYFPVAGAIAHIAETYGGDRLATVMVESTGGSMENLVRLNLGDLTFGIARSDRVHNAFYGLGEFAGMGPFEGLRTVFSLYPEPLTLIARADAGIAAFADLPGHRINLGPPGSDTRGLLELVLTAEGWALDDAFAAVFDIPFEDQVEALCADRVDLVGFLAGHPSGTVYRALEACPTVLVPIEGQAIDALIEDNPALVRAEIPGDFYPTVDRPVATLGPVVTLVTMDGVDPGLVRALAAAVIDQFDELRAQHPALRDLEPRAMANEALMAPVHPGAARLYQERGLTAAP